MSMATRIETDPLLPYDEDDHDYGKPTPYAAPRRQGIRDAWHLFWLSLFSVTILYWLVVRNPHVPDRSAPFELQKSWAQYSPYFPAGDYHDPPKGCKIIQANILQRHGARYPTSGAADMIIAAVSKLKSATNVVDLRLAFLESYTYSLGTEVLVPLGVQESRNAGKEHFVRYADLVSDKELPFVRASSMERVVSSATNWTEGFAIASRHKYKPPLSVIFTGPNNTLNNELCPNAGKLDSQTGEWLSKYAPPIANRLNTQALGADLTNSDVLSLISLCAFESVATGALSPFCNIFTNEEFQQFEYSGDLQKFYRTGYGEPLGRIQGVGYINELLARLTRKPVRDNTQTNRTLDASPVTFPLDRTIYADFSHDNTLIAIFAAMGLFTQPVALHPALPDPKRDWFASRMVPFSARMVTEKIACGQVDYVRVFVNDALQPLRFCGAGRDGLCELAAFIASQSYALNDGDGDFQKCFWYVNIKFSPVACQGPEIFSVIFR